MLTYDEMIKCGQKYAFEKKQMFIAKYKEFVSYLKKIINITFKDNEEQIVSYLKETSSQSLLLDWCVEDIHYDGFYISILAKTIDVGSLKAHDSYYDPEIDLTSDDVKDDLLSFFDKEYVYFMHLFIPNYYLEQCEDELIYERYSLVCKIANKFNEVCFNHFQTYFASLEIKDIQSFNKSKFSLSFTDERRKELDKEVYECYDAYAKKIKELEKKFDESVKDLK